MKHSLLMLLTFWGCTTLSAWTEKQIFVSPKGNDRAAGTFTHPLKSIQAALEKAGTLENGRTDHLTQRHLRTVPNTGDRQQREICFPDHLPVPE